MKVKSIRQLKNLKGRKVLIRVDFNVPIGDDNRVDKNEDYRIVMTLPTIKYLISKGAKVIILAHVGRPNGKIVEALRLDPVAKRLSQLLKKKVFKSKVIIGGETEKKVAALKNGEILMLENIRFDKREEKADKKFAAQLAKLADIYVNDGFAVSHRDQASVSTIQEFLPSYAGLLLEQEILNLTKVLKAPRKPLVVIIGGAKISTKAKVIKNFSKVADKILLGGALANTVLAVKGIGIGKSPIEPEMFKEVKKFDLTKNQIVLPVDGIMASSRKAKKGRYDALGDIGEKEMILDVGKDTLALYEKIIKSAKMIVWNGPMGLIENKVFEKGTKTLLKMLANSRAYTVIGGGETVEEVRKMKLEKKFNFISTGGGAMLEFLEGKKLPGLKKIVR